MSARSRHPGAVHITAPSFPSMPRPSLYRKIAYTFLGLTIIIVLAVLWLTSVKAEITVTAARETVSLDGTVGVAKDPGTGEIPGRVLSGTFEKIQEFDVLGDTASTDSVTTTTEPTKPPDDQVRARGTVRIINKYSRPQPLVRTTRLLTADGKLFRIDDSITVPAGGEVTVAAYADKTGYAFEIGPVDKFTIPGLAESLQPLIYAASDAPFVAEVITGNPAASAAAPAPAGPKVTQTDLDRGEKALMDVVLARAKEELAKEADSPDMEVVYVVKVVEKKHSVDVGQVASKFIASLKLDVTAVYYSTADMQALIRQRLQEQIPEGREFLPFEGSTVSYSLENADATTERAEIRVTADAGYRLSLAHPLLQPEAIAGKSRDEVNNSIRSIEGVTDVQIIIKPNWLNKIPSFKDKIHVTLQ